MRRLPKSIVVLLLCMHFLPGALGGSVLCMDNGMVALPCGSYEDHAVEREHIPECACSRDCTDLEVQELEGALSPKGVELPCLSAQIFIALLWQSETPEPRLLQQAPLPSEAPLLVPPGVRIAASTVLLI